MHQSKVPLNSGIFGLITKMIRGHLKNTFGVFEMASGYRVSNMAKM
jgi:hypothetical protein